MKSKVSCKITNFSKRKIKQSIHLILYEIIYLFKFPRNNCKKKEEEESLEELDDEFRNCPLGERLKSSKFHRALSLNLMKYQEMEKVLSKITKEKDKIGKSLQKLVSMHKNELVINHILKENKDARLKCFNN